MTAELTDPMLDSDFGEPIARRWTDEQLAAIERRSGDLLLQPIRDSIRRYTVLAAAECVDVVPATFVERAELLGSLALTIRRSKSAAGILALTAP